jgi:phage tail sheath protein FI
MAYNIGLNVVEVDGRGSPAIVGASTSVAAFNVLTQRGVANAPTTVTSFPQFVAQFGSYFPGGLGAYLVKGFFDNGGQTAYINRIVSKDYSAASITLKDGNAQAALQLDAGFRGVDDPGTWGNGLYVSVAPNSETQVRLLETAPATSTGTVALGSTVDMSAASSLSVAIDGQSSATVLDFQTTDFPGGASQATPSQIVAAINQRAKGLLTASLDSGKHLVLTSTGSAAKLSGGFSSLQVTVANNALGLATSANPVLGASAPITGTGTKLANLAPFSVGDAIHLTDGTNNEFSKLTFINPQTGDVTWSPAVTKVNGSDPHTVLVNRVTFNLNIAYGGNDAGHIVETWNGLSMEHDAANYAVSILNDPSSGSGYVVATDKMSNSGAGANLPASIANLTPFTTLGQNGVPTSNDFIGDQASHTGFYAFDAYDVELVTCERTDPGIVTAGLAYCAGRGDCMYVGAVPQKSVGSRTAITYGQAFQGKKIYGALYGPWIVVTDPAGTGNNPTKTLPPVGHVMGVFARIATARGIWKAPAGDEANLLGALDVEYRLSDADHTALVKQGSVNGIRAVPRSGVIIDASRTLSTDTRWLYVNVRLLFNYVKSSLKTGLSWVRQEPNRDSLWDAVRIQTVTPFLLGLWRQGAFGTGTAAQVFTVICDATNNPPDQVDQGNLTIEIYFYPSRPAETIVIIVGQQPSGATATES